MRQKSKKHTVLREGVCIVCKKKYKSYMSPSEVKKRKCCSNKCRYALVGVLITKKYTTNCIECNKIIITFPSENKKYCSNKCKGIAKRGIKKSITFRNNLSISRLDDANPNWKGDAVSYGPLHRWVEKRKVKPKLCENCKSNKPRDLANISGEYKRDITDFKWLCRSCHHILDGKIYNIKHMRMGEMHR